MITLAQLGCGYWGPNLLRNFSARRDCRVKWVAEPSEDRAAYVADNYPKTRVTPDWREAVNDPEVDAVIVATPAGTHHKLVLAALLAGKGVLVEKPLATNLADAAELAATARSRGLTLMAGHTFIYNPAVRHIKELLANRELGDIYYIYSQRLNLGKVRSDVNAWMNFAPHDVSILLHLMDNETPVKVSAHGTAYLQEGVEDVVFAMMAWENKISAHVHVSWLDPERTRRLTIVGSRKMAVYNDDADAKIAIYDKGVDKVPRLGDKMDYDYVNAFQLMQRTGDILLPKIRMTEPLALMAAHFIECVRTGAEPITGPDHAVPVVAVLEAGQKSMKTGSAELFEAPNVMK